jgi:hypothetical protein
VHSIELHAGCQKSSSPDWVGLLAFVIGRRVENIARSPIDSSHDLSILLCPVSGIGYLIYRSSKCWNQRTGGHLARVRSTAAKHAEIACAPWPDAQDSWLSGVGPVAGLLVRPIDQK